MTYSEAIEQVMLKYGGVASLKLIYKEIWNYKDFSTIKGKTPINTIQERVQRDPRFTRVGLGVYALVDAFGKIKQPTLFKSEKERQHAKIQGMLLEIGNHDKSIKDTYTNDKKWTFNEIPLGSLASLQQIPPFTYEHIIDDSVRFSDVIWFNERDFPQVVFEVEHSTDFRDGLLKFMELQDFQTRFYCVSNADRESKFEKEKNKYAFIPIRDRVKFLSYEQIESDYQRALKNVNIVY
ncbi:MAG: hypothetical protein IJ756_05050 [Paludibacteraceae bacterium]|nr:hypothetical protein [Paludibacteraceae bacterium]